MSATAAALTGADLELGIEIFSRSSIKHGGRKWERDDVDASSLYRLYRAIASEHWVRDPSSRPDHRTTVTV